jgi:DNA replication and repair protein RecF
LRIAELRAEGWRNLEPLALVPGPRVTVLAGDNGQGKTNIIEAIYYLARLRSFRTSTVTDLIQLAPARSAARLAAVVESAGLTRRIEVDLSPDGRSARIDGKAVRGAAAVLAAFSVVLFVPEDLLLPRAAPVARRRYLDLAVFGVERAYYKEAAAFQKVLRSRNFLLRRGQADPVLLDAYDEELARAGARVVMRRRALVADLAPRARALYRSLDERLPLDLRYRSEAAVEAAGDEAAVRAALLAGLGERRALDERRRWSGFGPQTDDLEVALDGSPARRHASQGQLRSIVLALKLAELTNVEARLGDIPVLLLDDVPSELDATRRRMLFEMVAGLSAQTIISVTERALVPAIRDRTDYQIAKGRVTLWA